MALIIGSPNPMTEKGASTIYLMARKYGMECRRLTWNPNYKGIDDWQLALRRRDRQLREEKQMTFKEKYLLGLCNFDRLYDCIEDWHKKKEDGVGLARYLGLTDIEYTLEVEPNGTVRQKRTMYDRQEPDIELAKKFLRQWQKIVSTRLTATEHKLAVVSQELRKQEFAELKREKVIIHTGDFHGRSLLDLLTEDLLENTNIVAEQVVAAAA